MVYKLHYFQTRGQAETARMMFHASGTKFEDLRMTHEEWAQVKSNAPVANLPYLDVEGHLLIEPFAINRFLANRLGFNGQDEFERALLDSTADFWRECVNAGRDYLYVVLGRIQGDKEALYKEKLLPAIDTALPFLENVLKKSGSGFVAPSGVSWVDFYIAEYILTTNGVAPEVLKKYPFALEYQKRVHTHPKVKSYVESRKFSPV